MKTERTTTTHPLLDQNRRALHWHRIRGLPAFWIGFASFIISLLGMLARIEDFAPLRKFGREVLAAIPPGGSFYREHFYFQFEKFPFATIGTLVGAALLIWGGVELFAASRIKRELHEVEEAKRKHQLLAEMEDEEKASPAKH